MAGGKSGSETEVKIRLTAPAEAEARLVATGFAVSAPRVFEANTVYDRTDEPLRGRGKLLRLREVSDRAILTFKGPAQAGKHKSREELETSLGDGPTAALILERLGFIPTFRYEKYRTEYRRGDEPGVATIDETPIGWFMELEGPPEWIDGTAAELGYPETDYLTDSYGSLFLRYCAEQAIQPSHMVFIKLP